MNFNADNPDHLQSNSNGLSTKNRIHRPTATLSGLLVEKVAMELVFLQVLWFAPNSIFPKCSTPILIHLILPLYNQQDGRLLCVAEAKLSTKNLQSSR